MALVKLNPIIARLSGKVGEFVFRTYGTKVVLSRRPSGPAGPPSEAQLAQRERFRAATSYGKAALADPDARAFYEALAAKRHKPILSITIADFLNVPVVDEIDAGAYTGATGDSILVRAHDDVEVAEVLVSLTDSVGVELESGPAVLDEWRWRYEAQTDVPSGMDVTIMVRAFDRPGNIGEASVEVMIP
jgi:hypothetical protein